MHVYQFPLCINPAFYLLNMDYSLSQKDEDMEGDLEDVCISFSASNVENFKFHSSLLKLMRMSSKK